MANPLWGDVLNSAGQRIGSGPVRAIKSASVTRALDGAGTVALSAIGTNERNITYLRNERQIRLFTLQPPGPSTPPTKREIGRGFLRNVKPKGSTSGWEISADGPDTLDELKRENTLLALIYSNQTVQAIAADLAARAGWTVSVDPAFASEVYSARYDGVSILKALQSLAAKKGLHLREGTTFRQVEIGAFGQASGIRLTNSERMPVQLYGNTDVMLIENISVDRVTEDVINWLLPVGGGEGESTLTLERCTRTGPYPVRTLVANGKTFYYIADDASMAAFGKIVKVGTFKDIVPISNSDADLEAAANALYDAAVAYLSRQSQQLDTYSVTVKKVGRTIRPGDKIRLVYKGFVLNDKGLYIDYLDVDEEFWVMEATERHALEGASLALKITSVDRMAKDAVQVVIGALEAIEINGLHVQPYPTKAPYVYRREIDATHSAVVPIPVTNADLYLNQCRLTIKTRPFRVTAKAAATGEVTTSSGGGATSSASGAHRHLVAFTAGLVGPFAGIAGMQMPAFNFRNSVGGPVTAVFVDGQQQDIYTQEESAPHTHTIPPHTHTVPALLIDYGIEDDNQFPDSVKVAVNGVDVTAALGGPWGAGGTAIDITLDITEYLVNASGGLRQVHQVELTCTGGQGDVEVIVELRTTTQSIAVI